MVNMTYHTPYLFSLGSHNYQIIPLVARGLPPHVLESIHKIYLLSTQHLIVRGSKKQQRRGWDYSQNEKSFQSHKKLRAIWGNLTLHHPSLPLSKKTFLFPSFWPSREYTWHLFEKKLSNLFYSPITTGRVERG